MKIQAFRGDEVGEFNDVFELVELSFVDRVLCSDTFELAYSSPSGLPQDQVLIVVTQYHKTKEFTFDLVGKMVEGDLSTVGLLEFDPKYYEAAMAR